MGIASEDLIEIAIKAGEIVLENGGEVYRTEQTVDNVAMALGARTASSFVTPTVIQFSYTDEDNKYHAAIKRIKKRGVNLRKVSLVHGLSRRIEKRQATTDPHEMEEILGRIDRSPVYAKPLVLVMTALSSFFFALLFNGTFRDALMAFVICFFLRWFLYMLERRNPGVFLSSLLSGAFISLLTEASYVLGLIPSTQTVLIAVLMQVVPGMAIVNAIRDIIQGDLVSGNARLVEAFMIAAGLSVGSVVGPVVFGWFGTGSSVIPPVAVAAEEGRSFLDVVPAAGTGMKAIVLAAVIGAGSSGFTAFSLNTDSKDIWIGAIAGMCGWVVFKLTGETAVSYLAGAFVVAAISEVIGFMLNVPAIVYLNPGLLPLVPGGGMFLTMRAAVEGISGSAVSYGYSTLLAAGSIALGIALVPSVRRFFRLKR